MLTNILKKIAQESVDSFRRAGDSITALAAATAEAAPKNRSEDWWDSDLYTNPAYSSLLCNIWNDD